MYGPPPFCKRKMRMTELVCANVSGLCWSSELLAWMECAALSSYLVTQPLKAFPDYRFRERRVRPLCHLMVRQQTWQEFKTQISRRWSADVGIATAISKPGALPGVMCRPVRLRSFGQQWRAISFSFGRAPPRPCAPSCWPAPRSPPACACGM